MNAVYQTTGATCQDWQPQLPDLHARCWWMHCRRRQRRLEKGQRARAAAEPPVTTGLPLTALGVASEAFQDALGEFLRADPEKDLAASAQGGDAAGSPGKKVLA